MAVAAKSKVAPSRQTLSAAEILSLIILVLTAVAAAGGLFLPDLYRDTAWVVPQNRGTDFVTLLLALPALAVTLLAVRRGSVRARIIWVGLLGYLLYIYTGAAMAYAFNAFFLLYVALFALTIFALVTAVSGIDLEQVARRFDAGVPRAPVILFLVLVALMLTVAYLGQILPFFSTGEVPEVVALAGGPTFFVWVLDLGLVVPLALLGALWLWRRAPLGYLLAGCVLIKAATMGLALLSMTWFSLQASIAVDVGLAVVWVVIAAGGLGLSVWFFRHCSDEKAR